MHSDFTVQAVWVIGSYRGEVGKKVQALANEPVGYIMIEDRGTKASPDVVVAFRLIPDPINGIPENLVVVKDPFKIMEFNKRVAERMGIKAAKLTVT